MVPIPGTTNIAHLDDNIAAMEVAVSVRVRASVSVRVRVRVRLRGQGRGLCPGFYSVCGEWCMHACCRSP